MTSRVAACASVLCMCDKWLEHNAQATDAAAATASKSLLESLDDSDDDFGGPAPLLSAASVVSPPVQPDAVRDTMAWRVQLIAAEAPCMAECEHFIAQPGQESQPMCISSEQQYRQMRDTQHDASSGRDADTLHSQMPVDNELRTTELLSTLRSLPLQTAS